MIGQYNTIYRVRVPNDAIKQMIMMKTAVRNNENVNSVDADGFVIQEYGMFYHYCQVGNVLKHLFYNEGEVGIALKHLFYNEGEVGIALKHLFYKEDEVGIALKHLFYNEDEVGIVLKHFIYRIQHYLNYAKHYIPYPTKLTTKQY